MITLATAVLGTVLLDRLVLAPPREHSPARGAAAVAAILLASCAVGGALMTLLPAGYPPPDAVLVVIVTVAALLALRAAQPGRIATCVAVLAAAVFAARPVGTVSAMLMSAVVTGGGFVLATTCFAALDERLRDGDPPAIFRYEAITVVTAAIACLAIAGLEGLARG